MIRTQDLEEYCHRWLPMGGEFEMEYHEEIIRRLRERDELKKELDELKSGQVRR